MVPLYRAYLAKFRIHVTAFEPSVLHAAPEAYHLSVGEATCSNPSKFIGLGFLMQFPARSRKCLISYHNTCSK